MIFKYSIARLVAAEKRLNKSTAEMLAELQGEMGASLCTTQALVAAGTMDEHWANSGMGISDWEISKVNKLIESHGLAAVGAAIGAGLKDFMAKVA